MRAKNVNENQNFERGGEDPKKTIGVGIKDYDGYVNIQCQKKDIKPQEFWDNWFLEIEEGVIK